MQVFYWLKKSKMQITAVLHQSAVPKESYKYKTLRYVRFVAKRKNRELQATSSDEVVLQKTINKFMIQLFSLNLFLGL